MHKYYKLKSKQLVIVSLFLSFSILKFSDYFHAFLHYALPTLSNQPYYLAHMSATYLPDQNTINCYCLHPQFYLYPSFSAKLPSPVILPYYLNNVYSLKLTSF